MTVASLLTAALAGRRRSALSRHGADLLVMAGGTVAMPLINEGISLPEVVMGLRHAGLDGSTRRRGAADRGDHHD